MVLETVTLKNTGTKASIFVDDSGAPIDNQQPTYFRKTQAVYFPFNENVTLVGDGFTALSISNGQLKKLLESGTLEVSLFGVNYNNLLNKLDSDTGVTDTDYNSALSIVTDPMDFNEYIESFNNLLNKLDSDIGVTDTDYAASFGLSANSLIFILIINYNLLLNKLDLDVGITDTDYRSSLGLT